MIQSVNYGIVGLPNVGKSTIFSAITSAPVETANYPFCTISPNVGVVEVPDSRLDRIHTLIPAAKCIPAITEFVDIAGLVKGSSKGEGLGNQFLSTIRNVGILVHVVRCFADDDVIHVNSEVNPAADIEVLNTELALADLQSVEKRLVKNARQVKVADIAIRREAAVMRDLLKRAAAHLGDGGPVRSMRLTAEEAMRLNALSLITAKTQIYVCNVGEEGIAGNSKMVQSVMSIADEEDAKVVLLCGKLESDIAALDDEQEKALFLKESGMGESSLSRLIKTAYGSLDLRTFFTTGAAATRAWTFKNGATAPQCAGVVHGDFERGFIKAEVYHCEDLFELGTESAVKSAGKLRVEGKEYRVRDGDVVHFKFNI